MSKKSERAIESALKALEKRFGEPVVMKMSESNSNIDTFSSGRLDLDMVLGGGYAVGKIIEIFAESGIGKTGLALEAISSIQSEGGVAAIIDMEHALNTEYCEQLGINIESLYISQPSHGEQAFEAIKALINTREVDLIVVDSVAAMIPRAELEGESGEAKIALQARMMSQGMKMIIGIAAEAGCTIIFINQLRARIAMYGASKTTTGGNALPFYATQRIEIRRRNWIKEGDNVIGFKQHIKIVKNKVIPPFKSIENDIIYGKGVDNILGMIESLVSKEILKKRGSYFYYQDVKIGQGIKQLRNTLEENPDLVDELKKKLKD